MLKCSSSRSMAKAAARPLTPTWPLLAGVVWDVFTCKGVQSIAENHQAVLTYAYAPRKLDLAKPNESLSMMRFHNGGVGDEDRVDKVMQVLNQSQRAVSKNSARSLLFRDAGSHSETLQRSSARLRSRTFSGARCAWPFSCRSACWRTLRSRYRTCFSTASWTVAPPCALWRSF